MTPKRTQAGWSIQLRYGKDRRKRLSLPPLTEAEASDRETQLAGLAALLATTDLDAEKLLETVAEQVTPKAFASAMRAAHDVATGKVALPEAPRARTFRDVAELWLSGELHRRFPDMVRGKGEHSVSQSRGILQAIYPHLDKDVRDITRADVTRAKADATPQGVQQSTRAHYARHIRIVMSLAVNPLELIEQSPVPPRFVPPYGPRRALGFLYPEEDVLLLGATDAVVPHPYRLYYGFLARNGMRPSEALRLVYGDLDLRRGILTLDKNKTRIPRAWKMADDVTRVLRAERENTQAEDAALVFPDVDHDDLAERFREHLWDAGVQRRELHAVTSERRPLRVHDLRGSFVTIALAHGANEDWVMRRTGHTTSQMLAKYRRQVEHAREVELGWYEDLGRCLSGEMKAGLEGVARGMAHRAKSSVELPGFQTWTWTYERLPTTASEPKTAAKTIGTSLEPAAEFPGVVHSVPGGGTQMGDSPGPAPAVESALAAALQAAIGAQQWQLAQAIVQELGERRRARVSPAVTSLADARRKRDGEGGK